VATRSIRANTTVLTDAQLSMLRGMLEEQRRFRIEQLATATEPQLARTEAAQEVQETILHGARLALREVESALARIAEARYGRCAQCDTMLPIERLEVLPQATLCMPCQRSADAAG
jgi:DnaK suppressor protein